MKNSLKLTVMLAVAMMLLAGCATTTGRDYDLSKVNQLVPGQTTVDQAVALLGEPQQRLNEGDGETVLIYEYVASQSSVGTYIPVVGLFDHGAKVKGKTTQLFFDKAGHYLRAETNQSNT